MAQIVNSISVEEALRNDEQTVRRSDRLLPAYEDPRGQRDEVESRACIESDKDDSSTCADREYLRDADRHIHNIAVASLRNNGHTGVECGPRL
jgi:hypothetical protein